jgi:signal transduction histidine kinase/CheY-like chemotaxis protein
MNWLLNLPPRVGLLIATALAAGIFFLDVASGAELRVYPLYFFAIIMVGSLGTRRQAYLFAGYCTLLWAISKYLDGTEFSTGQIWIWNTTAQALSFTLVASLVQRLAATLTTEKKISGELNNALRAVEDAERMARHDLRTPLGSIATTVGMLMSRPGLSGDDLRLLASARRAARRAMAMVNLSLALHRMEQGRYVANGEAVDLHATLLAVIDDLKEHADAKALRLDLEVGAGATVARGHPDFAYSLIANVLKNAIEAAPESSTVSIRMRADATTIGLMVANAGEVPEEVRASFFAKYATSGKPGGSGLGAYSARLMARAMGGELSMTTAANSGTTLTLSLPRAQAGLTPEPAAHVRIDHPLALVRHPGVLIVDDDEYNRLILRRLLPEDCAPVETAVNGKAAVDRIRQWRPDLIFMDINMPVMGGIEALHAIRAAQAAAGQAPSVIVAFSAIDDAQSQAAYLAQGFDACLGKPCSRADVMALLVGRPATPAAAEGGPETEIEIDGELLPMLPEFRASRAALLEELVLALEQGERDAARRLTHQLGGSLGTFGFHWASRACKALEDEIERGGTLPAVARAQGILAHVRTVAARPRMPS